MNTIVIRIINRRETGVMFTDLAFRGPPSTFAQGLTIHHTVMVLELQKHSDYTVMLTHDCFCPQRHIKLHKHLLLGQDFAGLVPKTHMFWIEPKLSILAQNQILERVRDQKHTERPQWSTKCFEHGSHVCCLTSILADQIRFKQVLLKTS